jgi:hypothetical protein
MLWGAFDVTIAEGTTPGYSPTQIVTGGPTALPGSGIGVRRCTVTIDRSAVEAGLDPALMHFDFLNMTAGNPDDTWTSGDYTTLEGLLDTMYTALSSYLASGHSVTTYTWHRVGTGVTKPNPAERVFVKGSAIAGAGGSGMTLQTACSITFRTGVRKSWGRTYLPFNAGISTNRRPSSTQVSAVATAVGNMVSSAATSDFHLVVVSTPLRSSLNAEHVEVDDVLDVIRRRRHKRAINRTIIP